ncbi:CHRD domain-containing protein [Kaistia sp. 32K]|uniref:CHRD domain-containing protein n=1 Tax=Kaistia sp. 32K TaxID=2795690 RepID=UPI0019150C7F|nr:CHRD domain-containing protein [Kaistia sp. 32K]BCP52682.1 CHRD domain-containing protein [Kaistia sp. 32K]
MTLHIPKIAFALAATSLLLAFPASAKTVAYKADLTGKQETPPNTSKGQGTLKADYDSANKTLKWTVTFTDLTGPVTAAHFHGPAAAGAKAPPVIPIKGKMASPITGSATLTAKQASELEAGQLYFNLHTAKFPDGEIRGQVAK